MPSSSDLMRFKQQQYYCGITGPAGPALSYKAGNLGHTSPSTSLTLAADTPQVIFAISTQHISSTGMVLLIANISVVSVPSNAIKFTICRSTIPRVVGNITLSGMINLASNDFLGTLSNGKSLGAIDIDAANGSCLDAPGEGDYYYTIWGQSAVAQTVQFYNTDIYVLSVKP